MLFFLCPQVLTEFTTQESYTFELHCTILFIAKRVAFKSIVFISHLKHD